MTAPRIFTPEYYTRMRTLESQGWWNAGMRDVQARLLSQVTLPEVGTALDVGCGSGQTMDWVLAMRPRWRVFGVDIARDGLRAAYVTGRAVGGASALALPFPDTCADLLVTLDVLQHLPLGGGDLEALREMRRVLKPGGVLLVRTNAQGFPRTDDDPAADFHKYTREELRSRLRDAGFRVHRVSRINAVLGLAEIPRELRARRREGSGYHGILARPHAGLGVLGGLKRQWLRIEGQAVALGVPLPLGRTLLATCVAS
jgi:SAM-dependent methyltransferase